MECSLTKKLNNMKKYIYISLNPYSNGMLSDTNAQAQEADTVRLNPYSNGMLSDAKEIGENEGYQSVLILILMECSLTI